MRHDTVGGFVAASFVLLAGLGTPTHAAAQQAAAKDAAAKDAATPYPAMASIDQYLMADRGAEIAMARSAAPASISRDATVLVLGRAGYETAVEGRNGFVCMVDRAWSGPFGWPETWNPRVRAAVCLNPQAARSMVPIDQLRTRMVMAGRSRAEIVRALEAAYASRRLPPLESGAMAYMLSPSAYLTDQGGHNGPHLMFYTDVRNAGDWGSGAEGSPIMSSPYWYFSPTDEAQVKRLPPVLVFLVGLPNWSDGTPAGTHGE